jgi:hypothetical protein
MNGLSCRDYNGADPDDRTRRDRAKDPHLTCVHCYSFTPEGVTPLDESDGVREIFTCGDPAEEEYALFVYITSE